MFNFFNEIKKNIKELKLKNSFNVINMSGNILYVEGHKGVSLIEKEVVVFVVEGGRFVVEGRDMVLQELSQNTLKITGKILKTEVF